MDFDKINTIICRDNQFKKEDFNNLEDFINEIKRAKIESKRWIIEQTDQKPIDLKKINKALGYVNESLQEQNDQYKAMLKKKAEVAQKEANGQELTEEDLEIKDADNLEPEPLQPMFKSFDRATIKKRQALHDKAKHIVAEGVSKFALNSKLIHVCDKQVDRLVFTVAGMMIDDEHELAEFYSKYDHIYAKDPTTGHDLIDPKTKKPVLDAEHGLENQRYCSNVMNKAFKKIIESVDSLSIFSSEDELLDKLKDCYSVCTLASDLDGNKIDKFATLGINIDPEIIKKWKGGYNDVAMNLAQYTSLVDVYSNPLYPTVDDELITSTSAALQLNSELVPSNLFTEVMGNDSEEDHLDQMNSYRKRVSVVQSPSSCMGMCRNRKTPEYYTEVVKKLQAGIPHRFLALGQDKDPSKYEYRNEQGQKVEYNDALLKIVDGEKIMAFKDGTFVTDLRAEPFGKGALTGDHHVKFDLFEDSNKLRKKNNDLFKDYTNTKTKLDFVIDPKLKAKYQKQLDNTKKKIAKLEEKSNKYIDKQLKNKIKDMFKNAETLKKKFKGSEACKDNIKEMYDILKDLKNADTNTIRDREYVMNALKLVGDANRKFMENVYLNGGAENYNDKYTKMALDIATTNINSLTSDRLQECYEQINAVQNKFVPKDPEIVVQVQPERVPADIDLEKNPELEERPVDFTKENQITNEKQEEIDLNNIIDTSKEAFEKENK